MQSYSRSVWTLDVYKIHSKQLVFVIQCYFLFGAVRQSRDARYKKGLFITNRKWKRAAEAHGLLPSKVNAYEYAQAWADSVELLNASPAAINQFSNN